MLSTPSPDKGEGVRSGHKGNFPAWPVILLLVVRFFHQKARPSGNSGNSDVLGGDAATLKLLAGIAPRDLKLTVVKSTLFSAGVLQRRLKSIGVQFG